MLSPPLNCLLRSVIVLCLCAAPPLAAQTFTVGLKGGVPFTDFFHDSKTIGRGYGLLYYTSKPVRYTIGPAVEFPLTYRFSLEASALYQRFHYSSAGDDLTYGQKFAAKTTGNAWSFPLLLKLRPKISHVPFYIAAGPVIRHLGGLHQFRTETIPTGLPPSPALTQRRDIPDPPELGKRWYPGVSTAGGLNWKLSRVMVSPELRYTRWTANIATDRFASVRPLRFPANQFDLLLGLSLGTRH